MPDICVLLKGIHRRKQSLPKRTLGKLFTYDPISPVAMEISNETCLLCFDEFQVSQCIPSSICCLLFCALLGQVDKPACSGREFCFFSSKHTGCCSSVWFKTLTLLEKHKETCGACCLANIFLVFSEGGFNINEREDDFYAGFILAFIQ